MKVVVGSICNFLVVVGMLVLPLAADGAGGGREKKPIRLVSLAPNLTELVFQLRKDALLVGRSSACDYPSAALKIPCVGDYGNPSLEKLVTVNPTLVIGTVLKDPALRKSLETLGIKVCLLPTESLEDYYQTVRVLGRLLGAEERARREIRRVKTALAAYLRANGRLSSRQRPKVYLEIWHQPYMTVGKRSFINDLITYAGGRNIAGDLDKNYFTCSEEWIIKSDPEVIICPAMKKGSAARVKERPGWKGITAVRTGRVYVDLDQDLVYRLGPRVVGAVKLLRKCIIKP